MGMSSLAALWSPSLDQHLSPISFAKQEEREFKPSLEWKYLEVMREEEKEGREREERRKRRRGEGGEIGGG